MVIIIRYRIKLNDTYGQFSFSEYLEYFAPDFTLHPDISTKQENNNTRQVKYTAAYSNSIQISLMKNFNAR